MDRVRKKLHADEVHRAGITGRGVGVAVLDSGLSRHPDYAERIAGCTAGARRAVWSWV